MESGAYANMGYELRADDQVIWVEELSRVCKTAPSDDTGSLMLFLSLKRKLCSVFWRPYVSTPQHAKCQCTSQDGLLDSEVEARPSSGN